MVGRWGVRGGERFVLKLCLRSSTLGLFSIYFTSVWNGVDKAFPHLFLSPVATQRI